MAKAATNVETTDDAEHVDTVQEVDDIRTGAVGEDDFIAGVARKAGWVPKEEWSRDPAKHVDARAYLERLPEELETAKDRLRRTAQANETALEDVRRQERARAIEDLRAAERAGDADRANAAAERVANTEGPPPLVQSWVRENPWFNDDPAARAVAAAVTDRLKARPIAEQLEAAEQEVRRRFPEHFGQAERREEPVEARLSEVRRPPPMATGSRGPSGASRERGWGDVPSAVRQQVGKIVKAYQGRGMTETEAQARYAKAYWSEQA